MHKSTSVKLVEAKGKNKIISGGIMELDTCWLLAWSLLALL